MLGFCAIAPMMDAMAKATPTVVPVAQILAARFGFQVIVLVPLVMALRLGHWPPLRDWALHALRGAALLIATGFFFAAVRHMPIANAIAIFFVEPFILTLLGAVFLGEAVGWRRIAACVVGFGGALLVIQPSFANLGPVALFPLGTACFFALYMVLTRSMAGRVHPVALQAHTAVAASAMILPLLIAFDGSGVAAFDPVWPTGLAVWTLLGVGAIATVSHIFLSFALKHAPASVIAPLQYLEIVGATAIGYLAFGDFPNSLTWVGIAIIVGSGLYVFARENAIGQRAKRPMPPP
jgi:drug/metabolite transporter (DMT)-like permease